MTSLSPLPYGPTGSMVPLRDRYEAVRGLTEHLAQPLGAEDQTVQSMPDASPTKWHRAHTTWFFETFVLGEHSPSYTPFDEEYAFLFNSYYEAVGPRYPRPRRGMITRPGIDEIARYRCAVDGAMDELLSSEVGGEVAGSVELGLHHEQQHQELLLMDVKHLLSQNPNNPAYRPAPSVGLAGSSEPPRRSNWLGVEGGLIEVGRDPALAGGFGFDHEGPRHRCWLEPYRIADRLVTCGEWLEFMDDGGYERPGLWLSEGWATVQSERWTAPLYWSRRDDGAWQRFSLSGMGPADESEPVCHVSHFEADAFARWAGARLPTEAEWEHAVTTLGAEPRAGTEPVSLHPSPAGPAPSVPNSLRQCDGEVWQWTASPYIAYPGFGPAAGAVGEYNGKFMSNQMVLRGGACVTPRDHSRPTYRNFFPSSARWMFGGLRLADSP